MSETIYVPSGICAEALQRILDDAPRYATVELAAGTYEIDQTIVMNTDGTKLVGASGGGTVLVADPSLGTAPAIQMGHALHREVTYSTVSLAKSAQAGSYQIVVGSGHGWQAGDHIYLSQDNTAAFFDRIGDGDWQKEATLRTFLTTVEAVKGDTLTLSAPLNFDYAAAATQVEHREITQNMGLADLTFVGGWGVSDPSTFANVTPSALRQAMVQVNGTEGTRLTNVTIHEPASHGIEISASSGIVARNISVSGAMNKGDGGNGYSLHIRDVYDSTFTGLDLVDGRHAVVFGSYTSATRNVVEIDFTNRDVNFHGGRDHSNTVRVQRSIRTEAESDYMAPTLFFNEGTTYGAPTDAASNTVTFEWVEGTVRSDLAYADPTGSFIKLRGGADYAETAGEDDTVWAGSGNDTVVASGGDDRLELGAGRDTVKFSGSTAYYETEWDDETLIVRSSAGTTTVRNAEEVVFAGRNFNFDDVPNSSIATLVNTTAPADLANVEGQKGWERLIVHEDTVMSENVEALALLSNEGLTAIGNDSRNHVLGSQAGDRIEGRDGDDRLVGMQGDDIILGGAGNDALLGNSGDDILFGDTGKNTLTGGRGADTFVGGTGETFVMDFDPLAGDTLAFNRDPAQTFDTAFAAFLSGDRMPGAYTALESTDPAGQETVEFRNALGESIIVVGWDDDWMLG